MDLNKHMANYPDEPKPFHSSGLARAAKGDQIGSTNATSFERRRLLNDDRRVVMAYNRSSLAGDSYKSINRPINKEDEAVNSRPVIALNKPSRPTNVPLRKYNPYS